MTDKSTTERDSIEELADSFVARFRAGQRPSIEEYALQYPHLADQLRELLPALVLLEQNASPDHTESYGGQVSASPVPKEIGDFTILREIARGGMGVVYEAIQQSLGRHVALKVLSSPGLLNPSHLERFRLEARAAARLHHTHIVPVFGVGEYNGLHYYAMQFIQGQSLDLVIDALRQFRGTQQTEKDNSPAGDVFAQSVADGMLTGQFRANADGSIDNANGTTESSQSHAAPSSSAAAPAATEFTTSQNGREFYRSVARVGLQVAEALAYAHSEGILHRDIKPSNLLLDARGNVWVTDFGLAQAEGTDGLTRTGDFVGTLRYMPPERLEGWSDRRSDLYSLGVTLYELLTLRPFLQSTSRGQLVDKILHESPAPPSKFDRQIPADMETIVLKAIGKEPTSRYRTAQEMADDLERFLGDRPILARRSTPVEQLLRWCRRNPVVAGSLMTVAATLIAGIAISSYFAASASRQANTAVRALEEAEHQRQKADHQRRRAELVNQFFMNEVFGQADPNVFKRAGISLVQALDTAASQIDTKFPDDPELRAMLQTRLGQIYSAMDEQTKATAQLESAAALWERVAGKLDRRTLACLSHLGNSMSRSGKTQKAKGLLAATLADQTQVLGPNHLDTLGTAIYLGYCLMQMGDENDIQQTKQTYHRALATLGPQHRTTLEAEYTYSWVLRWRHQNGQALEHARLALAGLRQMLGDDDVRTMYASYNYAACLQDQNKYDDAVTELQSLYDVRKRVLGQAHIETFKAGWRLASVLESVRKLSEAEAVRKELFSHLPIEKIDRDAFLANAIAWTLVISPDPTMRDGKRAIEMATKLCNLTKYEDAGYVDTLAAAYAECGDREGTLKWSHKIMELPTDDVMIPYWNALRFLWCGDHDDYHRARSLMTKQFATNTDDDTRNWVAWTCALSPGPIDDLSLPQKFAEEIVKNQPTKDTYLNTCGVLEYRSGNFEEAAKQLAAAIAASHKEGAGNTSPVYSQFFLAMTNWQLGKKDNARQLLSEAQAGMDAEMKSPPAWNRRATLELFRHEAEELILPNDAELSDKKKPATSSPK